MYPDFFPKLLSKFMRVAAIPGFCPYKLNPSESKCYIDNVLYAKMFVACMWLGMYLLLVIPTHILETRRRNDFEEFNFIIVVWLGSLMGLSFIGLGVTKCQEVGQSINGYLKFLKDFERKFVPARSLQLQIIHRKFKTSTILVTSMVYGLTILLMGHYILYPHSSPYFTYMISPHYLSRWMYIVQGAMYGLPLFGIFTILAAFEMFGLSYIFYFRLIYSQELRLGLSPSKYIAIEALRKPENLVLTWRSIQLILNAVNSILRYHYFPLQAILTKISVFCNVTLVLYWERLNLISKLVMIAASVLATVGWSLVLKYGGMIFKTGKGVVNSWKLNRFPDRQTRAYMKRFKRSCKPIFIGADGVYVIRPASVLNFLRGNTRGTMRALLSLRKTLAKNL
ncbi:unnamed protein product [Orchesella dallaii]|uniref:Gustatory receptor n=1 Tax=Orchesella dallaii TaxID=48710 RepID=A0ABP1S0X4_9HEXA